MSMMKVATLHARGLISDDALAHVVLSLFEKSASSTAAMKVLKETIGRMSPAPTASKLKEILVKTRMARPTPMVRSSTPGSNWQELPAWFGKVKGKKDMPRMYEGDPTHGGPMIRATTAGKVVGYGGTGAVGLAATDAVGDGLENRKRRESSKKGFKSMLKENPDIAKIDAVKVRRSFKTLNRLAPDLAKDPQISGAFVRRAAGEFSELGIDPKTAKDLLDTQNSFLKSRSDRGSLKGAIAALGIGTGALH